VIAKLALAASDIICRVDFRLRRYAERTKRGSCPRCKGILLCVARGMYRCGACRTPEPVEDEQ
jgi:hypothetical protein